MKWLKQDGEYVERDEVIAELESEKATFEVNAEKAGMLKTVGKEGDTLKIGDVVAQIDESAASPKRQTAEKPAAANGNAVPSRCKTTQKSNPESMRSTPAVQEPLGTYRSGC